MDYYRYRKSSHDYVVEAVQLTKENVKYVAKWCNGVEVEEIDALDPSQVFVGLNLLTEEGSHRASEGSYIVKDPAGYFHVAWQGRFEHDFEKVD